MPNTVASSSSPNSNPRGEWRSLWKLAFPLVVAQAGQTLMGITDTAMAGHISGDSVAALGLSNTLYFFFFIFPMGVLLGLDPLVSQAAGAKEPHRWRRVFNAGRFLSLALAIPFTIVCFYTSDILAFLDQPAVLLESIDGYMLYRSLALPAALLYLVHSTYLSGHGDTRPFLVIAVLSNLLNIIGNDLLIHGRLGIPEMGLSGIGLSTFIAQSLQLLALLWVLRKTGPRGHLFTPWQRPDFDSIKEIFRMGLPIGTQFILEFAGFGIAIIFMGWIGAAEVAGHQVALNVASLSFTVALGIGSAASIRVGHAVGRNDLEGLRKAGWTAWQMGILWALASGALLLLFREPIAALYGLSETEAKIAVSLLGIAAVFQLVDTAQAIGFGILRGLGDTRLPVIFNVVAYWGLGIPLGYVGAFHFGAPIPEPIWWGLSLALLIVAFALVLRFRALIKQRERDAELASSPRIT